MKSIGFFGDSFCVSRKSDSWCVILAKELDMEITHWGSGGASIWQTMLEFNKVDIKPDVIVFCWTHPNRLYHPTLPLTPNAVPMPKVDPRIFEASELYYKYLQNDDKDNMSSKYALQWFDQNELRKFDSKHKIVQMWSFFPQDVNLTTGKIVEGGMIQFAWGGNTPNDEYTNDLNLSNHMSPEKNKAWAKKIKEML